MPRAKATKTTTETKTASGSSTRKTAKTSTSKRTSSAKTRTRVAKKSVQNGGNKQEVEEVGKRYFKCIMINADGKAVCSGRYSGKKPKQAASKACTRLYKEAGKKFPKNIVFLNRFIAFTTSILLWY